VNIRKLDFPVGMANPEQDVKGTTLTKPTIRLDNAHDVRKLHICSECRELGQETFMPLVGGSFMHGMCAFKKLGAEGLAALGEDQVGKVSLSEIGVDAMMELIAETTLATWRTLLPKPRRSRTNER
jgi:hypothetical protein